MQAEDRSGPGARRQGRVLVTGPGGFVGRALVPALAQAGWEVVEASRARVGPIGPDTDWARALTGVVAVVHLAAHVHVAPERAAAEADAFETVNHLGSVRLLREAARAGARRFVFLSSITVLGDATPPGRPFDDTTPPDPKTPYGQSKRRAEDAMAGLASELGVELTILRPPLICGAGVKGNLASLARLAKLPVPLPLGALRNRRTLLSLPNLVDAIGTVLRAPRDRRCAEIYCLGDAAPLSTSDIVGELAAGAGRRARLIPAPVVALRGIARLAGRAGQAQRLFGDLEVDSRRFRYDYGWCDVVDTRAALRASAA